MDQKIPTIDSPWPGPRPYDIHEGAYFFGREDEIAEIRRLIKRELVTILSAESGAGKSSLLRAGIVYRLLRLRNKPGSDQLPVLLLSNWGGPQHQQVDELFRETLKKSIESIRAITPADYEVMSSLPEGETFFDCISNICEKMGGLILILDQFEEVLRGGTDVAGEAIGIITEIYRYERRAHLVISLRSEYHKDLHNLEAYVGGLYARTTLLEPMVAKNVRQAVLFSAREFNISFSDEVVKTLIRTLVETSGKKEIFQEGPAGELAMGDEKVDLLTLQAILRELFNFSRKENPDSLVIDAELFKRYCGKHTPNEIVGEALERWINTALNKSQGTSGNISMLLGGIEDTKVTGLVRRVATRMASYLSSGGYKTSAEEDYLLFNSLREDFTRLRPQIEATKIEDWEPEGTPPTLNHTRLNLAQEYNLETRSNLSGLSRQKALSPADTADILVSVFFESLARLQSENIIKPIHVRDTKRWELVHDGLGKPFNSWAEKQRSQWDDCISALTACRGVDISITPDQIKEKTVTSLTWQGCFISTRGNQVLDNFFFFDCDLKGTVFENCRFRGGGFNKCILDGALFLNCSFESGIDNAPFQFNQCQANALTFLTPLTPSTDIDLTGNKALQESALTTLTDAPAVGTQFNGVRFDDCQLEQVKIAGARISGNVVFGKGTKLTLCNFTRLTSSTGVDARLIFPEGTRLIYCAWDKKSQRVLDIDDADYVSCGLL